MKRVLLLTNMLLVAFMVHAQTFQWAEQFRGTFNYATSIDLCSGGEMIISGAFQGTVDFDPGEGTYQMTSFGDMDAYVVKIAASGNLIWAKQMGGAMQDYVRNVTVDAVGNVYLTGSFQGTIDMDPGDGVFELTSLGGGDIFLAKLDEDGNFVGAGQIGGSATGIGTDVAVSSSGMVYFSGYYIGAFDFDPGASEYYMTATGQSNYVVKLNSNLEFVWAKTFGGPLFDYCQVLCVDESDNVYTIGSFKGVADFDPGEGTVYLTSAGGNDIYVNKLNANGDYVWAKQMSGPSDEFGMAIVYDGMDNLYITGNFKGTVNFAPDSGGMDLTSFGDSDIFIGKMDTDGHVLWVNQMGGVDAQSGHALTLDNNDDIYVTGYFVGTADFNPGDGTYEMTSAGDLDIFVSKLNNNGSFAWAAGMGGTLYDRGMSIITNQNSVYTTGLFAGIADFDPGEDNFLLSSQSERATFISKLGTELLGVGENFSENNLLVYPNPVNEDLQIGFDRTHSKVQLSIINLQGQVIFNKEYLRAKNLTIKLKGNPGLYFMHVVTDDGQADWVKIIKK